jgi:hypothetical protein
MYVLECASVVPGVNVKELPSDPHSVLPGMALPALSTSLNPASTEAWSIGWLKYTTTGCCSPA